MGDRGASLFTALATALVFAVPAVGERADIGPAEFHTTFGRLVIRQTQDITCGPAALANLFRFQFGIELSEEEIVADMLKGRRLETIRANGGFSLLDVLEFVEARGYNATGEHDLDLDELTERLPAIVQVAATGDAHHFLFVLRRHGDQFAVVDPAVGGEWIRAVDMAARWTGIALVVAVP